MEMTPCPPTCTSKWLPPGFRFHPTDEELITYYLVRKIAEDNFVDDAIPEVDLNAHEPWELPGQAQMMGDREWYVFTLKDKKYPMGCRTNRATKAGYWKATGKDKEVILKHTRCTHLDRKHVRDPIGMKKTLVFYEGRAPKGLKTNWVMHEYRLHDQCACISSSTYNSSKDDTWVLCRVFYKKKLQHLTKSVQHSPQRPSTKKVYSFVRDCVSNDTNHLQVSPYNKVANNDIIHCNLLPPLCNGHIDATLGEDDISKSIGLLAPIEELAAMPLTLPITLASSQQTNFTNDFEQINTMLNEELDTILKSIPHVALPHFPSELESLWLQTSSFFV
ncbi:hypothetical protein L7F22_053800 [Adiantum nelumboides]|nr:hypothetical protein [Adiantum nelumboides]